MKYVYANLIGNWECLNDDPDCKMGEKMTSPSTWWEENAEIYSPFQRLEANTYYHEKYINIHYRNVDYRIHPIHIQIVTK